MIEIIEDQPDDSTSDDLLRELAFNRIVTRGLEDLRSGQVRTTAELRHQVLEWQG